MVYTISELNQMGQEAFVEALGTVFEHTPAIAHQAWCQHPFADVNELHQAMVDVAHAMSREEQLALIRAHPDLGSKAKMAVASVKEQAGVGLDRMTEQEYNRFLSLNQRYKDKFGFPFIIAVKNHTKDSIFAAFEQRLGNTLQVEMQHDLTEITEIARFRLVELIT